MKCRCCDRVLSNDPMDENFGLWTDEEPRWTYCAPLMTCSGCGCAWREVNGQCPECGSRLYESGSTEADFTNFCARATLAEHTATKEEI